MVEFINSLTGTRMFVDSERVSEYIAAGHTSVDDDTAEPTDEDTPAEHKAEQTVNDPPKAQPSSAKPATKTSRPATKTKPATKRSTTAKK